MTENEILLALSRVIREARTFEAAIAQAQSILTAEIGSTLLLVHTVKAGASIFAEKTVIDFLESRVFPFRGVYSAPLNSGRHSNAVLVGCIGSWGAPTGFLSRAIGHIARQLDASLARVHGQGLSHCEAA